MNYLAAVALAAIGFVTAPAASNGWYLLQPNVLATGIPDLSKKYLHWQEFDNATKRDLEAQEDVDLGAPLSRWIHVSSLDTARVCEDLRQRLIDAAKAREPELRKNYPDGLPTLGTHLAEASRCIASDDPRLAIR